MATKQKMPATKRKPVSRTKRKPIKNPRKSGY